MNKKQGTLSLPKIPEPEAGNIREMLEGNRLATWIHDHRYDAEVLVPDKTGCECFFLENFINEDMKADFPAIVHDFLKHRMTDLTEEWKEAYANENIAFAGPMETLRNIVLNRMYVDAKNGNPYSRELFRCMYRTYYRKEYQQLKRFRTLSGREAMALCTGVEDNDGPDPFILARVLSISEYFDVEIRPDCAYLYKLFNDFWDFKKHQKEERTNSEGFDEDLYQECRQQVREWMKAVSHPWSKAKELKPYRETASLLEKYFQVETLPAEFVDMCREEDGGYIDDLTDTLYGLCRRWPNREDITFEDVQKYRSLYSCVRALDQVSRDVIDFFTDCLTPPDYSEEPELAVKLRFDKMSVPSEETVSKPASKVQPPVPIAREESTEDLQALAIEVENLRRKLHQKEQDLASVRAQLDRDKKEMLISQAKIRKAEEEREELIALRDHLYNATEQDVSRPQVELSTMEKEIGGKRIVIIGGHSNWTYKLKNKFRNWVFLEPKASGSIDGNLLNKADRVFFFSEIISHSTYYKFVKLVREREIPFGYIHSINIESNIRQIYEELKD